MYSRLGNFNTNNFFLLMKRGLLEIDQALTVAPWQASKAERKGRKRERRLGREGKSLPSNFAFMLFSLSPPLPSRFSFVPGKHFSLFSPSRQIKIEMPGTLTLNYSTLIINSNVPFLSSCFRNFYRAGV